MMDKRLKDKSQQQLKHIKLNVNLQLAGSSGSSSFWQLLSLFPTAPGKLIWLAGCSG